MDKTKHGLRKISFFGIEARASDGEKEKERKEEEKKKKKKKKSKYGILVWKFGTFVWNSCMELFGIHVWIMYGNLSLSKLSRKIPIRNVVGWSILSFG